MINKIHKIINNKFLRIYKFVFFLRYLFLIFFLSIALFLVIPNFFDYKKKENVIKAYILKNYGLELWKIGKIDFKSFPIPKLEIEDVEINFLSNKQNIKTKKLKIYPKLTSIYNFRKFEAKKIKLEKNDLTTDFEAFKLFLQKIIRLEKKIHLDDLNVRIKNINQAFVDIKRISFLNYGYKKNIIRGEIFEKKFKIKLKDDLKKVNFVFLNSGISFKLNFLEKQASKIIGKFKGKVLKTKLKFDFSYDDKSIDYKNFFLRDKKLSFNSNGKILLQPYLFLYVNIDIKNFDENLINNLELSSLLKFKNFVKKLNVNSNIQYKSKKFQKVLFNKMNFNFDLAYGYLKTRKQFFISDSTINCDTNVNLLEDFPLISFDCSIKSKNKKKFLKKFEQNYKYNNEVLNLDFKGALNILNNKIRFESVKTNNYQASSEDLEYFKVSFEKYLLGDGFIKIFDTKKIKNFLNEIL